MQDVQTSAVRNACRMIEQSSRILPLEKLAAAVGLSPFYFHRQFKRITGTTPKKYADSQRAALTRREVAGSASVTAAIYRSGFSSNSRFYKASAQILGMTPRNYRAGGSGTVIQYAIAKCWLGIILVAATPKGICAIQFGNKKGPLLLELQEHFSKAEIVPGDKPFQQTVARVIQLVSEAGKQMGPAA